MSGSYVADVVTTVPSPTQPRSTNGSVSVGKWVYLVEVSDNNAKTLTLYNNGVGVTPTATGSTVRTASPFTTFIGKYKTGIFTNGSLDDVRIYNRALSATEVKQLYALGTSKQSVSSKVTNTSCTSGLSCGLVGYWTFDGKDMPNGVAIDKSGNGNNGNAVSIATSTFYTEGKIGQAGKFDGVNDYVSVPDSTSLDISGSISISVWAKRTGSGLYKYIVAKGKDIAYQIDTGGNGTGIRFFNGITVLSTSPGAFPINTWIHIVAIYDGSQMIIYINGVAVASTNSSGAISTNSSALTIGTATSFYFDGSLDDVRIYNRALSTTEVKQLYNLGR